MRKLLFAMLFSTILVFAISCVDKNGLPESPFNVNDTLSNTTALAMCSHYLDSNVDHSLEAIIKQIYFDADDIKDMVNSDTVKRVKLLTAAYLNSHPDTALRNKVTIIIQLKKLIASDTTYTYYDIRALPNTMMLKPTPLCPPPPDCIYSIED